MFSRHTVRLKPALFERAAASAGAAGYSSVDEFVAHAVEKELARLDAGIPAAEAAEVEKQLRGLGYIE
ncbi:MAG: hypothetical protein EBY17_08405 [Acidobacteriia bacterium]|nr:hypothetical protein [Terriglobia bacterium]